MKKMITVIISVIIFKTLSASPIDVQKALKVAENFSHATFPQSALKAGNTFTLVYQCTSQEKGALKSAKPTTFYYVVNSGSKGFIVVSGDDATYPILGYSYTNSFNPVNIPQNVVKWLESYKEQIRYAVVNNLKATQLIANEWSKILNNQPPLKSSQTSVAPLLATQWSQSPYYNADCPGGSVTGCVATGMAQIMKYWNYPANGTGFHSYNHATYGTLSANFGSTTYQWGSMPTTLTGSNSAVATLMYQCGVSVDMDYSPTSSGAYVISAQSQSTNCAEYAFKTYFGYKSSLQGVQRKNYSETQWLNLIKAEFDASRPVLYAGFGGGGGHCFVADGYDNSNYIHFNWGWNGAYDGYFSINALNPSGTGTGGGTGGYNAGHQAVIGIEPPTGVQTYNMALYNYVTPSASSIYYGQAFTITTNIVNNGGSTFNGDYCAAIFDNSSTFIDYVEIKTGFTLQAGYAYIDNLVFSNSGLFGMLPGTYSIGIFYRPTGGNWVVVANNSSYTNLVQMNIINPNDIELNSNITVTPGTTLTQGQSASINLNLINNGTSTFTGTYGVGLYNLDGTFAQTIGTITENNGLPSGYTYNPPYLTFNSPTVTVNPGTYLIAVQHNPNNTGWQLTGSSYHLNPIKVTVVLPNLLADAFESNNTSVQAYTLPVTFSVNSAALNTAGSNIHNVTDYDNYKINLSAGYNYTISARLHDSYISGNGNTYSADVLFSYSTDGTNWSDAYDDIMPGNISINGNGTVYFKVAPFFAGVTGTYLLDLGITRTTSVGIAETELSDLIKVYPNPAKDFITIDLNAIEENVSHIQLMGSDGKVVNSIVIEKQAKLLELPVKNLPEGVYILKVYMESKTLTRKVMVVR